MSTLCYAHNHKFYHKPSNQYQFPLSSDYLLRMASSKVMSSRSPTNQDDHPRQPSPSAGVHLHSDQSRGFGSMNIDDFIKNMYSDPDPFALDNAAGELREGNRSKTTVEDVWRDIVSDGAAGVGIREPAMTLEDFLAKAGAVNEEDVRVSASVTMPPGAFGMETAMMTPATGVPAVQFTPAMTTAEFGMVDVSGGGRGKRREAVEMVALDKAKQQKQRRMIKNRESAARSRERKQAYSLELESLVSHLEEENERLLKEEAELKKTRYKQLMENLVPVVEMRRPPRVIKRVRSMEW